MLNKFQSAALVVLVCLAALFGWWQWSASSWRTQPERLVEALTAAGWRAEIGAVRIAGAPARLDLSVDGPALAQGGGRWGWSADRIELRRLIYRPDFLSLSSPGRHRLETPFGPIEARLRRAEASLVFGEDGLRPEALARLSLVAEGIEGEAFEARGLEIYLRPPLHPRPGARRFFIRAVGLRIGAADPVDLEIEGTALFDRPLARDAVGAPEVEAVILQPGLRLRWRAAGGETESLSLAGEARRPSGADPLRAWRGRLGFESDAAGAAIDRLQELGLLDGPSAEALRARRATSGRLAGVLEIDRDAVKALDLQPEPIPLKAAQRQ